MQLKIPAADEHGHFRLVSKKRNFQRKCPCSSAAGQKPLDNGTVGNCPLFHGNVRVHLLPDKNR